MVSTVAGYRIFLASPGGLEAERSDVQAEVDQFNRDLMHDAGAAFSADGWERVPGSKRRAQELINEHVEQCDFMVVILWNRWGSAPDTGGEYTSGTEEEFRLACRLIDSDVHPMRDILVLFKGVPESQLQDPGPQLQNVLSFKAELEASKGWLYKTFDSSDDLRREIRSRLLTWAKLTSAESPGPEAKPDATASARPDQGVDLELNLLQRAEGFASQGLVTQAEAAYAKAIADGDLDALQSYSRFLRRVGRPSRSLEIGERIISDLAQYPDSPETAVRRSRVMADQGVTQRKFGRVHDSRYSLTEAVQAINGETRPEIEALAYALDNLGLTNVRSGDVPGARTAFNKALALRMDTDDAHGRAATLLNLARLDKRVGALDEAIRQCTEALELLDASETNASVAAAHSVLGEIYEAQGDPPRAMTSYKEALRRNEAIGRPASIALSLMQLARLLFAQGELAEAERLAERAHQDNTQASNREGMIACQHLLGRIAFADDRPSQALGLLQSSVAAFADMGNPTGEGWARLHLAEVLRQSGQTAEAEDELDRVSHLAETTGNAALTTAFRSIDRDT